MARTRLAKPFVLALGACAFSGGCTIDSDSTPTAPAVVPDESLGKAPKPPGGGGGSGDVAPVLLQGLDRRSRSVARAVNSSNLVVGWSTDAAGVFRPVRWLPQGGTWGPATLLSSGSGGGAAYGVNDAGFATGYVKQGGQTLAVVWRPDGTRVDLGPGLAYDINALNTVVVSAPGEGPAVWRHQPSSGQWAFEVLPDGAGTNGAWGLDDLEDVAFGSRPEGVNPHGGTSERAIAWRLANGAWQPPTSFSQMGFVGTTARDANGGAGVAGAGFLAGSSCAVALYWPSATSDPVVIPGLGSGYSEANDINGRGEIAGRRAATCTGDSRGFWWSPVEGLRLLAGASASASSYALGLNSNRTVVGYSQVGSGGEKAAAWKLP